MKGLNIRMLRSSAVLGARAGVSRTETVVGVLVLLCLVGIAAAILVKQGHYDPQVIHPTLAEDRGAPTGEARTVRSGTATGRGEAAVTSGSPAQAVHSAAVAPQRAESVEGPSAAGSGSPEATAAGAPESVASAGTGAVEAGGAAAGDDVLSRFSPPPDVRPLGAVETFDAASLSDKIDGRAEFYLDIGFEALATRRFEIGGTEGKWFEAYVYRMSTPLAAFAAWSGQRRPDARPEPSLVVAYASQNALYFARGNYYVELVSAWDGFGAHPLALAFARALREAIPAGDGGQADVLAMLPEEDRVAGSERLILKDVFGFSRLDNVIMADYVVDGTTVSLFVSPRASAAEAAELAKAYHSFLTQDMGADDATARLGGMAGAYAADALKEYDVFKACGSRLVGIHAAKDWEAAVKLLDRLCREDKPSH